MAKARAMTERRRAARFVTVWALSLRIFCTSCERIQTLAGRSTPIGLSRKCQLSQREDEEEPLLVATGSRTGRQPRRPV